MPMTAPQKEDPAIRTLWSLVLLLLLCWSAVSQADTQPFSSGSATATYVFSITIPPSCPDRFLAIGIGMGKRSGGATAVSTIVRDGQSLTLLAADSLGVGSGMNRVELWGLVNPNTGTNNATITVNDSGGTNLLVQAIYACGIDQAAMPTNAVTATAEGVGTVSANITTTVDDAFVLGFAVNGDAATFTSTSPQVEILDFVPGLAELVLGSAYQEVPTAGLVTVAYEASHFVGSTRLALAAVELKPSGGGGASPNLVLTHTVTAALSNDMLCVACATGKAPADDNTIASVTWDVPTPEPLTFVVGVDHQDADTFLRAEAWCKVNPTAGTDTLTVVYNGTPDHKACAAYSAA